jgi:hypothetical protein
MSHALLGPSGAKRWMSCTPSARLEEQMPDSTSSFAEEGTAAHEYAELKLDYIINATPGGADVIFEFAETNPYYNAEMEEAVNLYIDTVMERYNEALAMSSDAVLLIEQRLEFTEWVPEGFGTGDVVIIADETLEVIDLKYGKGVPVDAKDNPQLRLYGLGAWNIHQMLYDIKRVRMTIVQPRLDSVTTDEIAVDDLVAWADNEVRPAAETAWAGAGEFVPGDHCKFCKVKAQCRALAEENLKLAEYDFAKPPLLFTEEIADILGQIDRLVAWASDVKAHALLQAETKGIKYPGWKLVEGRSNRVYTDEQAVITTLVENGYEEPVLFKPREVLGITAMEKVVGKKKFEEVLGTLIAKPTGKPTLVPETDKRPEINTASSAEADFT